MTVSEIIKYLKLNVSLEDSEGIITSDTNFIKMKDEDLALFLNVVFTRDFAKYGSLELLPTEKIYPLTLLAKKELYYSLCSKLGTKFDLGADNNNYLKRSQMFNNYMKLIQQVNEEYDKYMEDDATGTGNTMTSYDVLLPNRYGTRYNYEKGVVPVISLYVGDITKDSIAVYWRTHTSRFANYKLYLSEEPILDLFKVSDKVVIKPLEVITDVHQQCFRFEGLKPLTAYYIVVSVTEMSSLTGYSHAEPTTIGEVV